MISDGIFLIYVSCSGEPDLCVITAEGSTRVVVEVNET